MTDQSILGGYRLRETLDVGALGGSFRAERDADPNRQQLIVRVFDGATVDSDALWQDVELRSPLQQLLRGPGIAPGLDMGRADGKPYLVYPYSAGRYFSNVLERWHQSDESLPLEQSLLFIGRLARAMQSAYLTRIARNPTLHGFLVPELIRLTNRGEVVVEAFEFAPALRRVGSFEGVPGTPFLAPEVLAAEPPHETDDVVSLGAILLQLLTDREPRTTPEGAEELLSEARIGETGEPVPDALADLIQRSLAPRAERIPNADAWADTLRRAMRDLDFWPSTLSLEQLREGPGTALAPVATDVSESPAVTDPWNMLSVEDG